MRKSELLELLDDPDIAGKIRRLCGAHPENDRKIGKVEELSLFLDEARKECQKLQSSLYKARDENAKLKARCSDLEEKVDKRDEEIAALKGRVGESDKKIDDLDRALHNKQTEMSDCKKEKDSLEKNLAQLQTEKAAAEDTAKKLSDALAPFADAARIYREYMGLPAETVNSLSASICTGGAISLVCSAVGSYKSLYSRFVGDNINSTLLELYDMALDVICEMNTDYEKIDPKRGDYFDSDLHNDGGRDGKTIAVCVVKGLRNTRTGKVETKAKVRTE